MISKYRVFVGSAQEDLDILEHLQRKNTHARTLYFPWTNLGTFPVGGYPLPSLIDCLGKLDGAVFLAFGQDKTWWRNTEIQKPRDNVIFEAGLAIGLHGIARTVMIVDDPNSLPSDFTGLKPIVCALEGFNSMEIADNLHAEIQPFFDAAWKKSHGPLSYSHPERFPEIDWAYVLECFPSRDERILTKSHDLIETYRYGEARVLLEGKKGLVAQYLRARMELLCGNFELAKILTKELLESASSEIANGNQNAYYFFELAARRLIKLYEEYDYAREQIEKLSSVYSPIDLFHLRGIVELQSGNYHEALKHYDKAISAGTRNIWTYLDKGECHYRLGDKYRLWDIIRQVQQYWPDSINAEGLFHYLEPK